VDAFDFHNEFNKKNTVVMISAFEHHSNILPWKEKGVEVKDQTEKKNFRI
jgi:selenocysteine lyase/cysteine desulfurase